MSIPAPEGASHRRMSTLRAMLVLGMLEAFGPLSMDLYLPQLPQLAASLGTTEALGQATMSACMIGLGLGQLVAGPLSDRFGRRRPLMVGVTAFAALSVLCAVAPNIELLLLARFLQGLAGSAGIVICLAIARDQFEGAELSRMLSLLFLVSGTAPIIAPVLGGQLARIMDWRGIFWVLGAIGVVLLLVVVFALPETLRPAERHGGGLRALGGHAGAVVRDRLFLAVLCAAAGGGVAFFTYLSMSSFVLQDEFGLSPQTFSLAFAAGALASIVGSQTSRLVVRRWGPLRVYLGGVTATLIATAAFLVLALTGTGVLGVVIALIGFMLCSGIGGPNGQTLALAHHGSRAGTASALLGMATFLFGPVLAPVAAGIGGTNAVTMAVTMAIAAAVAALAAWAFVRPAAV
ncbi:DHA1 family bicyclomycin/chloramphenicol resistance-like MFS transporter [Microbacterium saperdae]|uniref:DHA1 family bicyclomycin/chloramphenicol resistance-like MFS transporter n=2 Tax=Microbacterium saperdae TaxID=69368 RepID=A0A543BQ02_9MICO|nr:DHA1 family bicyclomycin/chloramphenicol resistance-like MFS transporter [Microbacterium saperdae]